MQSDPTKVVKPARKPPAAGMGRKKGSVNKTTALLKDAIIDAAVAAGDGSGLTGYLEMQAREQPVAFMTLLGKVLPMQVTGENGGPIKAKVTLAFN